MDDFRDEKDFLEFRDARILEEFQNCVENGATANGDKTDQKFDKYFDSTKKCKTIIELTQDDSDNKLDEIIFCAKERSIPVQGRPRKS